MDAPQNRPKIAADGTYSGVPIVSLVPNAPRRIAGQIAIVFLSAGSLLLVASRAGAQVSTWTATATTWEDPASWSPAGVPASTATAQFTNVPTDPLTGGNVLIGAPEQIGQIQFASNARAFFFFGAGTLTINGSGGVGIVNSSTQPQEFVGNPQYILGASQSWGGTGDIIFDQPISGAAFTLTKTGTGALNLTGNTTLAVNTFNANGGTTIFDNPQNVFTYSSGQLNVGTGGTATLILGGFINNQNNAINAANVAITIGAAGTLDSAAGTNHNLGNVTLSGGTIAGSPTGVGQNFTLISGSTVLVNGTTTSTITSQRGIQLTAAGGTVTFNVGNGASLGTGVPDLIVSAPISGIGALNKTGLGIMRLAAPGTYSGATTINAGTLQLASPGSTGSGTVTNSGTLSGNGTVGGTLNTLNGGTVQPNNPATNGPGRLTQTAGNTDFASGSTLAARIGGDADNDASRSQLSTVGTLTFPNSGAGAWTVDVSKVAGYTPTATPHTYTLALAGAIPSTGLNTPVTLTATGSGQLSASNGTTTLRVSGFAAGDSFTLSKQGNLIVLNFIPVPEPFAVLAVFGVGLGFVAWRRRSHGAAIDA